MALVCYEVEAGGLSGADEKKSEFQSQAQNCSLFLLPSTSITAEYIQPKLKKLESYVNYKNCSLSYATYGGIVECE